MSRKGGRGTRGLASVAYRGVGTLSPVSDRFNFANHTYTPAASAHINADLIPKTLELQVYGPRRARPLHRRRVPGRALRKARSCH